MRLQTFCNYRQVSAKIFFCFETRVYAILWSQNTFAEEERMKNPRRKAGRGKEGAR